MTLIRHFTFSLLLFIGIFGFAAPMADSLGISTIQTVQAQNQDVETAGDKIKTSVVQLIQLVYDKLRLPISLLAAIVAVGVAMVYRRQGVPTMLGIFGFIFLWAFAPVIVNFLIGLAGGGGPIQIK
ncbi:MAG TPA: hypothetical protein PKY82_34605 [Pyrinomonadaceae bacterium]|nr:hypothetical protein [Pyrinomonadaceae bacterium]